MTVAPPACAILCPGPSLSRFPVGLIRHHQIIAVNDARELCPHDYWCAGDAHTFYKNKLHPNTKVVHCTAEPMPDAPTRHISWSSLGARPEHYSMVTALRLAKHLGFESVAVFGCDWAGSKYFNGIEDTKCTHAGRWKAEREAWEALVATIGIPVVRYGPIG
jgi:hypothetical protein